jgi:His-Xaa-Ser system protein HxsD
VAGLSATEGLEWIERHPDGMTLSIDSSLYPDEAVFRTCYGFTDRCYMFLQRDGNILKVRFRKRRQSADLDGVIGQFGNDLINHRIRYSLARETRPIRELIVAQAFAEAKFDER